MIKLDVYIILPTYPVGYALASYDPASANSWLYLGKMSIECLYTLKLSFVGHIVKKYFSFPLHFFLKRVQGFSVGPSKKSAK